MLSQNQAAEAIALTAQATVAPTTSAMPAQVTVTQETALTAQATVTQATATSVLPTLPPPLATSDI